MGSSPIRVAIKNPCELRREAAQMNSLFFASVAQLVEQGTENPCVSGSIPL